MIIGCISLVRVEEKIVTIECTKGRGRILPGGKWEKPETFKQCASRELREETGLIAKGQTFVYGGMSPDGAYVNTFLTEVEEYAPVDSKEGRVLLSTWADLYKSEFRGYYEILHDVLRARGIYTGWLPLGS